MSYLIAHKRKSRLKNDIIKKSYLNDLANDRKQLSILEKMVNIETKRKEKSNEKIQEVC